MNSRFTRSLLLVSVAAVLAGPAHAVDTANLSVLATVNANCNMQASPAAVDFLTFNAFAGATATGQVSVQCNRGATVRLDIDNGGNFASGTRNMASGSNVVPYSLYQPNIGSGAPGTCGGTTAWGAGAGSGLAVTSLFSASGGVRNINVCGSVPVPGAAGYAVGSYTDTVVVTAVYN